MFQLHTHRYDRMLDFRLSKMHPQCAVEMPARNATKGMGNG